MFEELAELLEAHSNFTLDGVVKVVQHQQKGCKLQLLILAVTHDPGYTLTDLCLAYKALNDENLAGLAASLLEDAIGEREAIWDEISACYDIFPDETSKAHQILEDRIAKHEESCPECRVSKLTRDDDVWVCRYCGHSHPETDDEDTG